jgi:glycosyltransferase involved in cell wall biosynthesis
LYLNHNVVRRGGTFYRAFEFARHLGQRGHDVTLMTISPRARIGFTEEMVGGVRVVKTPDLFWGLGRTGWDLWDACARILRLAGDGTWDVVHAWDCRPVVILPALYARSAERRTKRLVIDWCDWWGRGGTQGERRQRWLKVIDPVETFFEEAFRTRADGTTVISGAIVERAAGLGVSRETIRLLPQGCELVDAPAGGRSGARQRLNLASTDKIVISIGALIRSDADLLFSALPRLFERRPDCRFFLIGKHGAQVPVEISAHPQFRETGFLPASTLDEFVTACDCLLTPLADTLASRARWPSKINPVIAAGRTVVVTRVGDFPRLLEQEGAAAVADCSSADLVDQTIRVLGDDHHRMALESRARHVASDLLAWPILTAQLEEFYLGLRV